MEECRLINCVVMGDAKQGVFVGENRSVLGDDVKQVHSTCLYRLGDMQIS